MDTIEIEREVFDALINRIDFLHKTVKALYEQLRDKKLSDCLTTKQTCDYLHISERKLRGMKERLEPDNIVVTKPFSEYCNAALSVVHELHTALFQCSSLLFSLGITKLMNK